MKKRVLSFLLALAMLISLMPSWAMAGEALGQVRVIVKNDTCPLDDTYKWEEGSTPWQGTLVDVMVDLDQTSTVISCLEAALGDYAYSDSSYVTSINGLRADGYAGWMFSLNDWFPNEGAAAYTVASGNLKAGDEICFQYSMLGGSDIGSVYNDSSKTLAGLTVSGGTLTPDFVTNRTAYQLALGEGNTSGMLTVTPTASNKNFQVRVYKGTGYSAADEGYNDVDLSVAKTAEELKSPDMVAVLGDQYRMDADGSINGGYPVLF